MDPVTVSTIASTLTQLGSQLWSLTGPIGAAGWMHARAQAITDYAVTRGTDYAINRLTVDRSRIGRDGNPAFRGAAYVNLLPQPEVYIRAFHQSVWGADGASSEAAWRWLQEGLKNYGIDTSSPTDPGTLTSQDDWAHIIRMAATAAPLDGFLLDWRRRGSQAEGNVRSRLDWTMQRAGYSDPRDRDLLLRPWHRWSAADAARLRWLGLASDEQYSDLVRSAGYVREDDHAYAKHLARVIPSPGELWQWEARHLWDDGLAVRYGLDVGNVGSPGATYWSKAQGYGVANEPLPGEPEGGGDWLLLAHRAAKRLPGFGESITLQHRLRPDPAIPGMSVRPGVPQWTADNTRDMLTMAGYTEPVIERLLGLVETPLSTRVINRILVPSLRNETMRRAVEQTFGVGVDWVKSAYQDVGLSEAVSQLAADGQREQADRTARAEWWAHEKAIREERRKITLAEYRLGTITQQDAVAGSVDEYFDPNQARDTVLLIDREIRLGIIERQLKEVKNAWLSGAITTTQGSLAMIALGIQGPRQEQYGQEWRWEKTEHVTHLSTGNILSLFKQGMITYAVALARLDNLGWNRADALLELAAVERTVAQANAKAVGAAQAKAAHTAEQQQKQRQAAILKAHKEAEAVAKKTEKVDAANLKATHQRLMHQSKYYAAVHRSNAAYEKAEQKGNEEKMAAELEKQIAEYHHWLIEQVSVAYGGQTDGSKPPILDTVPAPGPGQGDSPPTDAGKPGASGDGPA